VDYVKVCGGNHLEYGYLEGEIRELGMSLMEISC
jgi:hypothetical protein